MLSRGYQVEARVPRRPHLLQVLLYLPAHGLIGRILAGDEETQFHLILLIPIVGGSTDFKPISLPEG